MAVMYTVLSTVDTGLLKTLYTKITPSSDVVPAGKVNVDTIKFVYYYLCLYCETGPNILRSIMVAAALPVFLAVSYPATLTFLSASGLSGKQ